MDRSSRLGFRVASRDVRWAATAALPRGVERTGQLQMGARSCQTRGKDFYLFLGPWLFQP